MSAIETFFRHCPSCGRRFEIRLVGKQLKDAETLPVKEPETTAAIMSSGRLAPPLVLVEGKPIIVDIEEFEYTYRCRHCGHQWTEMRETKSVGPRPEGYTGD